MCHLTANRSPHSPAFSQQKNPAEACLHSFWLWRLIFCCCCCFLSAAASHRHTHTDRLNENSNCVYHPITKFHHSDITNWRFENVNAYIWGHLFDMCYMPSEMEKYIERERVKKSLRFELFCKLHVAVKRNGLDNRIVSFSRSLSLGWFHSDFFHFHLFVLLDIKCCVEGNLMIDICPFSKHQIHTHTHWVAQMTNVAFDFWMHSNRCSRLPL